jgi:protoheme IX farnesyltransferase
MAAMGVDGRGLRVAMAETRGRIEAGAAAPGGEVGDFIQLMKPRVMSLVVFTALTGLVAAPGGLHPVLAVIALIAIAVGAGASGALNMWWDADIDARMSRTEQRPIPQGRVTAEEALTFGMVLSIGSVLLLGATVNWLAGGLLALTIAFYVVVYTMWLKRRTAQNIVIGGAAGAFPPMIGWAAVTGSVSLDSVLLFLIIFMWTPPHFWALALLKSRDYERVGVPMLPVVAGGDETRRQIMIYSVLLVPLALAPVATGLGGIAYAVASVVLGAIFLGLAVNVWRVRVGEAAAKACRQLFLFSILYLFLLFAVLLAEHAVRRLVG